MIRLILFLCLMALAAFCIGWMVDQPGAIVLTWRDHVYETSVAVGLGILFAAATVLAILWTVIRIIFRLPSIVAIATRQRKRGKGYAALSRGMIAAGAGDTRLTRKAALDAAKYLPDEPLALLLKAQAAQLAGDRTATDLAFTEMTQRPATKLLGLRGLHIEAHRRGDAEAAHHFAHEAHQIAPLPWSAKAVLDHRAAKGEWQKALDALQSNIAAKLVDKPTGERQKAVLETALALEAEATNPDEALRLARLAAGRAPGLVPAVTLAARLLSRKGEIRKAAKLIETAWLKNAHPDLADVYLDVRPGDSNADRLNRARMLLRLAPREAESRIAVARAALASRDFAAAREAMAPLIAEGEQPTTRACLIMADLEDAEHGATGNVRAWLARASRAPRDEVWMADGVSSERWMPASPVTGKLDAFTWQRPPEGPVPVLHLETDTQSNARDVAALTIERGEIETFAAPDEGVTTSEAEDHPLEAFIPMAELPPESRAAKPVIFPLPAAPDDPGTPEAAETEVLPAAAETGKKR